MMELLRRFEEESAEDAAALEAEEEEDNLANRLETLDLGASVTGLIPNLLLVPDDPRSSLQIMRPTTKFGLRSVPRNETSL